MLTPTKVSTKTNCVQRINSILHDNLNDNIETDSQITELTKNNFDTSTDYRVVYKNFDYSKPYDAWIYEGNDEDKIQLQDIIIIAYISKAYQKPNSFYYHSLYSFLNPHIHC